MQMKSWTILAAITAVSVAGAIYSVSRQQSATAQTSYDELLYPELAGKIGDVSRLTVTAPGRNWRFQRQSNGDWTAADKFDYPADVNRIKQAVVAVSQARIMQPKTGDPARHERLNLRAPTDKGAKSVEISVAADETVLADLITGKTRKAATKSRPAEIYARRAGEDQSWLVAGYFDLKEDAVAWLDKKLFKVERLDVFAVAFSHPDGETANLKRDKPGGVMALQTVMPDGYKEDEILMTAASRALEFLNFRDVKPAKDVDFSNATRAVYTIDSGVVVTVETVPTGQKLDDDATYWTRFSLAFDPSARQKDEKQSVKEAKAFVKEAAARVDGWAYLFTHFTAQNFIRKTENLIEKKKAG